MKKLLAIVALAAVSVLSAADKPMALADARGKIGAIVNDPPAMTAVMKQLSAEDQVAFLSEVNAAIAKMPGSADEQAAKFLAVDRAALLGAKEGNLTALVAEVYATVPPNALTVVNESFAADLFNRSADPSKTFSDGQFKAIAQDVVDAVEKRTATADSAGVRNTFAILMMIRASNGSPADLRDSLVASLDDATTRDLAQNEWISPALGVGQEKTYDPMLGAADAGVQPDADVTMNLIEPYNVSLPALLGDLASECSLNDASSSFTAILSPSFDDPFGGAGGVGSIGAGGNSGMSGNNGAMVVPRSMDPTLPYGVNRSRGRKEPRHYVDQGWQD